MFNKKSKTSNTRLRRPSQSVGSVFRRNNVVISRSQRQMAARQQSVTQRQQDIKRRRARLILRRKIITITLALIVAFIFYMLSVGNVDVQIKSPAEVNDSIKNEYRNALRHEISQHSVAGQRWLIDESAVLKSIQLNYPEISEVEFSKSSPSSRTIKVHLAFRVPRFIWHDATKKELYVDGSGVLFERNFTPSKAGGLIVVEDQGSAVLSKGATVLSQSTMQFVASLPDILKEVSNGIQIERVVLPQTARELHVYMKGSGYYVKLSLERSLQDQQKQLQQLLGHLNAQKNTPKEYIDLRIANRAYYK